MIDSHDDGVSFGFSRKNLKAIWRQHLDSYLKYNPVFSFRQSHLHGLAKILKPTVASNSESIDYTLVLPESVTSLRHSAQALDSTAVKKIPT